ncbi:prolyl endopeptidase [Adhaeribacter aerolatus]|uniref:prolyl oligopeptidase n=1 Tax=Adhaeribacter aerolatus TaxID=670289 RepID=A0A512ASV6_9BACT|nr:prolyl oligopeptidase family serine peptidase [Adhaeribacter aerolatus]GEO02796.1 prolyl endopeptidase [Adhaeribacter aerolatus]
MNKITFFLVAGGFSFLAACQSTKTNTPETQAAVATATEDTTNMNKATIAYPETEKVTHIDNYHGTEIPDPYRWLENDTSEAVANWVQAQNKVTFNYLGQIPFRDKIKERLTKIWNYPKYGTPFKRGENYYFYKNDGLQNQSILYVQKGLNGTPEVFIDPNKFSTDGTTSLTTVSFSKDNKYVAYGTSGGGSDWNEFYVLDATTKEKLSDKLAWIKFSGAAWFKDGFFYSRYDAPKNGSKLAAKNEYHKVYYHQLGTPQSEDKLIYEDKTKPLRYFSAQTTDDERYLVITVSEGATSTNALYVKELRDEKNAFIPVVSNFTAEYNVIDNLGDKLLVQTTYKSPKNQIVLIDPKKPQPANWKTVVPQSENVISGASLINNRLIVNYMKNAASEVVVFDVNGKRLHGLKLPTLGTVTGFSGKKEDKEVFYTFNSFTYPSAIYKYTVATNTSELFRKTDLDVNMDNYETKQVFYPSKDGTKVPMFIVHKKGLVLDGNNPTYLYGYGGFNVSYTPGFSISRMLWLENGGVFVLANLRGGGEFGEEWHKAGMTPHKQNVFDDFIAAAEYLIQAKYTSPEKLAIAGGSNGGLLVGAVANQRPELFKVALPAVGVMDMLRFHKFTIGWGWVPEYGSSDNPEQFKNLLQFSPLHNIKDGVSYPATLVTTADHDDRVVPAHSFKYIARLQEKGAGPNPYLIRVAVNAGHGAGKSTAQQIEEATDIWSFVYQNMGVNPYSTPK